MKHIYFEHLCFKAMLANISRVHNIFTFMIYWKIVITDLLYDKKKNEAKKTSLVNLL